jgi:hypothetical protein
MVTETITDIVVVTTSIGAIDVTVPERAALVEIIAPPIHVVEIEELGGPPGPPGPPGDQGLPGSGIVMKGHVPTYADLPEDPNPNDGWVTADTSHLWVWNGYEWVDCGVLTGPQGPQGEVGNQVMYIGATPPPTPLPGHTWWNPSTGNMFVYYNDGNSSQWVAAHVGTFSGPDGAPLEIPDEVIGGKITIGVSPPTSPAVNDIWIDTN